MINVKDIKGNVIYSTPINQGSKRKFELMQADHITLIFSLDTPINFPIGCYVDDSSIGLFERVDNAYKPKYNSSTGGYDYELQLDAYYRKWQNKIFKFTPEVGGQEASWSLTASLDVQMGIFLRNLQALGYTYRGTEFEFSIDATVENKAISMAYENMNMLDALSAMAESWECEWWVTDNVIHFGRCEYGTSVDFELNVNVAEMTRSESKSVYATRIYAFGSTKNLPADYRPVDESVVVNGVVQRRLMLPEGTPYVDAYEGLTEEEAIEQVVVFEDVYPRTQGSIDSVETYDSTVENEDGTNTTETFYRFKDSGITFSEDYILEGEELRIKFESGSLNGMEFGLAFNPTGASEKLEDGSWNPEAQLFEIVASEDYGRKLPDSTLKPQAGDTYILIGWDSTKIADLGLVSNAENELLDKAQQYIEKSKVDPNTYQCKMMSDYMYGLDDEGNFDTNYAKVFEVGDRVNLVNEGFFENGRQSRIIGYEYNLDYPYDNPIYTVGETASYSRIGDIESKLDALTYAGQTYTGVGGGGVYLIGTNDTTKPTNRNAYSALKADQHFLRKDQQDTAKEVITFDKGLNVGEFVSGASGASLFKDLSTGQTIMELDKLYVRMKAFFETLDIVEVQTISGKQIVSPAGSVRCTNVEEYDDYYRCYFLNEQDGEKIENKFIEGDQAYSQMFNAKTGTSNKISNRYYWRLVTGVGENYIDLSKTDCDTDSDVPMVGDILNQRGHRYPENSERMNFIETSTVDGFSPSITLFHGVNSFSLSGKDYVQFGVDKTTNKAFMNVYGDMYVGDRNQTAYIRYTQEDGLELCGKLAVGTKLGDKDLQELIDSATPEGYQEFVEKVTQDIEGLQAQIDGVIDSYFFQYEPSLDNYPASDWDTESEQQAHLNDTFTNLVDGRSWRWSVSDGVYGWVEITDTATTKALALAGQAQNTADGKRRVFVDTPYPPYDKGDLWSRGSDYPLMICVNPKDASGVYAEGDFDYADNNVKLKEEMESLVTSTKSELNNAIGQAKDEAINNANNYTDEGKKALQASIDAMEEAKANVVDVYSKSEADGKISDSEERALKAAQDEADAAIAYYDTIVKAYADGTATEEELAEIAGAKAALDAAKAYAEEQAQAAKNEIENSYLFQALQDAQSTEIDNGLVLTSLIQLRDTDSNIMSGINGLINANKGDKSIATWWGGGMYDLLDYYTWDGNQWVVKSDLTPPSNIPSGLIRMDGTGYLANGKFWWDEDGKIYADPTALFLSFDVDAESGTLSATILDILDKQTEFTNMWSIETDSNGTEYLYTKYPLVSQGGVTMYHGTSGLDLPSIYDGLPIDGTTIYWENGILKAQGGGGTITEVTSAMIVDALGYTPYDASNPNGYITSSALSGYVQSSSLATVATSGSYNDLLNKPTLLSSFTNDVGYLTSHQTIYNLTLQAGTFSAATFDPNADATTVNIPTTTSHISEGSNLYFTNARAVSALSSTLSNYLPLSGGTITGSLNVSGAVVVQSDYLTVQQGWIQNSIAGRGLYNVAGDARWYYHGTDACWKSDKPIWVNNNVVLHAGNYSSYTYSQSSIDSKLSGYLPLSGGTMTGALSINRSNSQAAYDPYYLRLYQNSTEQGRMGADLSGGIGIYATGKIYLRPSSSFAASTLGVIIASDAFTYNGSNVYHSGILSTLKTDLGLGSNAYTSTTYLPSSSYTAADVLAKLLTVDGSGSGLDADTLDGKHLSDILASNVASATKLQTARTIWGQSFDGTGNVSGAFTMPNNYHIYVGNTSGSIFSAVYADAANNLIFGEGAGAYGYNTYIGGQNLFLRYGGNKVGFILNSSGNVGIGTTNPAYPLDVNGRVRATILESTERVSTTLIAIDASDAWSDGTNSHPWYGYDHRYANNGVYSTTLSDYFGMTFKTASCNISMTTGNVGIGTYTPSAKLHVAGDILSTGGMTMYSQRSLKNVIDEKGLSLEQLSIIKPTRYTWKDKRDDRLHIGGIADDIEQVLPEVVYKTSDGVLTMDYGNAAFAIASSLIQPVIAHENEIASLKRKVRELEEEVKRLKSA